MSTIMYDGIDSLAGTIHQKFPNAKMVAGYLNGKYAWSQADWNLFPHANHVTISITASANVGDVLDVEPGDATPAQTHDWIAHRKAAGLWRPTIYCPLSKVPSIRDETREFILDRDYDLWIADWDGTQSNPYPMAAAKQYLSKINYDATVVYDGGWPHRKQPLPGVWTFGRVRNLSARPGKTSVDLDWYSPNQFIGQPSGKAPGVNQYEIAISPQGDLDPEDATYPRYHAKNLSSAHENWQVGSLSKGTHYAAVRAMLADGSHSSPWSVVKFTL